jgi:hypothetical protein
MATYGFVYLLNHDYMPNVYKIGFTDRAPLQRVQELSNSTSVPSEFNIVCYGEFANAQAVEQGIHRNLEDDRINPNREFFHFEPEFVLHTLIPWFRKEAINYTECNEIHNLELTVMEIEEAAAAVDKQYQESFPAEIVDKSIEVIAEASGGSKNA